MVNIQPKVSLQLVKSVVSQLLDKSKVPLILGGDHSLIYPVLQAYSEHFSKIGVIYFDAHTDVDEPSEMLSNWSVFSKICALSNVENIVNVGARYGI